MLQLASLAWQLSLPETFRRMARLCQLPEVELSDDTITAFANRWQQPWLAARTAWERAVKSPLMASAVATRLGTKANLRLDPAFPWQQAGLQRLVGCLPTKDFNSLLGLTDSSRKVHKGRGWHEVLISPSYDLPGRICGFWLTGDETAPLFQPAGLVDAQQEAGLAMPTGLWKSPPKCLFGLPDQALALRLQAKHLAAQSEPLPLVVWRHDEQRRTQQAWRMFAHRKVVLWAPKMNAELILQAQLASARLATKPVLDSYDYFSWTTPQEFVNQLVRSARPWPEVANRYLLALDESQTAAFWSDVRRLGGNLEGLQAGLSEEVRHKLQQTDAAPAAIRVVSWDRQLIEERPEGWYAVHPKTREELLVSPAILRIDQVLYQPKAEQTYYRGRILFKGRSIEFCEPKRVVERNPADWMQHLLIRQQVGLFNCAGGWSKKLVPIATSFHEPAMVKGAETVGWDAAESCYVLPQYRLLPGGHVQPQALGIVLKNPPAQSLPLPGVLAPTDVADLLDGSPQAAVYWATWSSCVAAILAPALGHSPRGLAWVGPAASTPALQAADDCGALRQICTASGKITQFVDAAQAHNWPHVVLFTDFMSHQKQLVLEHESAQACSLEVNPEQALALLVDGGWRIVNYRNQVIPGAPTVSHPLLLPTYLHDVCLRSHRLLGRSQDDLAVQVLDDAAVWLTRLGCPGQAVLAAKDWFAAAQPHALADVFADTLYRLLTEHGAQVVSQFDRKCKQPLWTVEEGIFVPQRVLKTLLLKQKARWLNMARLTEQLLTAGILIGDLQVNRETGWLLDGAWFHRQLKLRQAQTKPNLKVVS